MTRTPGSARAARLADVGLLASSAFMFLAYHFIFLLFHRFDWGQPFVKLACFETLFLLIMAVGFKRAGPGDDLSQPVVSIELVAACALLLWTVVQAAQRFQAGLGTGMNDLGETTEHAARLLFVEHKNPFQHRVAPIGNDPAYFGYKYGPTMIFFYALAGFVGRGVGIKITNIIYLAATAAVVAYLAAWTVRDPAKPAPRPAARAATAAWACAMTLLPERLYHETFNQGAQDIFPIMMVLLSAAFAARRRWLLAGLVAGLSFSSRFAPGAFLLVLFLRRRVPLRLAVGVALGMVPFVPFLIWDAPALVRNVFLFHGFKAYDSTSLYSVTPRELQPLFSVFQIVAILVAVAVNFRRAIEARALVVHVTLLLIAIEVSYREMHGNHLIWFMPTAGLIFAWGRHDLPDLLLRKRAGASQP
jgi:hypothetical protein